MRILQRLLRRFLFKRLFERWLYLKFQEPSADIPFTIDGGVLEYELETVRRLAPKLNPAMRVNVTHRRLQHIVTGVVQSDVHRVEQRRYG